MRHTSFLPYLLVISLLPAAVAAQDLSPEIRKKISLLEHNILEEKEKIEMLQAAFLRSEKEKNSMVENLEEKLAQCRSDLASADCRAEGAARAEKDAAIIGSLNRRLEEKEKEIAYLKSVLKQELARKDEEISSLESVISGDPGKASDR